MKKEKPNKREERGASRGAKFSSSDFGHEGTLPHLERSPPSNLFHPVLTRKRDHPIPDVDLRVPGEYCGIHESDGYFPHEPDHIIAEKHGGPTSLENLAWSCLYCNRFKGSDLASVDPISQKIVRLFRPRTQKWNRHFRFNGALIEGITASGRATVALFRMNNPRLVADRLRLIALGHYPPPRFRPQST